MISDEKFGKRDRILKTGDFRKVYKKGLSLKEGTLLFYYLPNKLEHNRLGISIGSRYIKSAVTRNKIKRTLREVFRKNKITGGAGNDIVVVLKKEPGTKELYKNMEQAFLSLIKRAKIN